MQESPFLSNVIDSLEVSDIFQRINKAEDELWMLKLKNLIR